MKTKLFNLGMATSMGEGNSEYKPVKFYFKIDNIYIYCHVIAHGDDRNRINTILPLN